jgi:Flp pilus assembly protein TadG
MPRDVLRSTVDAPPKFQGIARANAGSVIIEFAFIAPILALLIVNILDFSLLIWARMQVNYSAQVGAQAAFKTCSAGTMPAVSNCTGLSTAVTSAIQATSLGTGVTLTSGYPTEAYYCVSGTTLQFVGSYSSPPNPFNCSAVGSASTSPGDYIEIDVTYSYTPTFAGLSLVSAQTLTGKSMERLQ